MERPSHNKIPSTPNFENESNINEGVSVETNPFILSVKPDKQQNLTKKILGNDSNATNSNTNINTSKIEQNKNRNFNNSLYSTVNFKDSLYSNLNPINGNINNNNFQNLLSGNTIYTSNNNRNNNAKSLFRMTMSKKETNKSHLTRGSLYDDFLKKNHPDNVRKTMLKDSKFKKIKEGVKENDEIESEKEEEEENENENIEKKRKENDNELKKSLKLKYSLSFEDDDKEENEDEAIPIKEEDDLLKIVDDDDELKEELKDLIDDKKKLNGEENKNNEKKPKSILKKKNVKFNESDNNKNQEKALKKSNFSKASNNTNNTNFNNSVLEGLDKFEEKLKKYQIMSDRDEAEHGFIKMDSQLEISFPDDNLDYTNYERFNKDIKTIKKLYVYDNNMLFNINLINNMIKQKYIYKIICDKPSNKLKISFENNNLYIIDKINEIFHIKNKTIPNTEIELGKDNINSNKEEVINTSKKDEKRFVGLGISKNKIFIEGVRKSIIDKNNIQKKEISKEKEVEIFPSKKTIKENQEFFTIYSNSKSLKYNTNFYSTANNTFNGNNRIDMNNYNTYNGNSYNSNNIKPRDMNSMRYNQSYSNFSAFTNKEEIMNRDKRPYYAREDREEGLNPLKVNKRNLKQLSPKRFNKIKNIDTDYFSNFDNQYETNSTLQKLKKHYKIYEDRPTNIFHTEDQNYKTLPTKSTKYNSVKNIKDEVIGKRNEIAVKIQHCQNLLNTLKEENKRYNKFNSTSISFNKFITTQIPEQKKSNSKKNVIIFDGEENLRKGIKYIYNKKNKLKKIGKNFIYEKPSKPEIGVNIENNNGFISLRENKVNHKNNALKMRTYFKKDMKDLDNSQDTNNYSFDNQRKKTSQINKEIHTTPSQRLIGIKRYGNGNDNISFYSNIYINKPKNPEFNNKLIKNTLVNNRNKQFATSKKTYKNLTDNINDNFYKINRIRIPRTDKKI